MIVERIRTQAPFTYPLDAITNLSEHTTYNLSPAALEIESSKSSLTTRNVLLTVFDSIVQCLQGMERHGEEAPRSKKQKQGTSPLGGLLVGVDAQRSSWG